MRGIACARISHAPATRRTSHFVGSLAEDGVDAANRRLLPWPSVIVILKSGRRQVFLERFDAEGHFAGDTWHSDVTAAKEQAAFEYGDALGEWTAIPPHVDWFEFLLPR